MEETFTILFFGVLFVCPTIAVLYLKRDFEVRSPPWWGHLIGLVASLPTIAIIAAAAIFAYSAIGPGLESEYLPDAIFLWGSMTFAFFAWLLVSCCNFCGRMAFTWQGQTHVYHSESWGDHGEGPWEESGHYWAHNFCPGSHIT